jgi:putative redox protein
MPIEVTFPGAKQVHARIGAHVIQTDQPADRGGADSAPTPYDLFLASIATCAGIYVLGFCQARGLSTEGIVLRQDIVCEGDEQALRRVTIEVSLPCSFPQKYESALLRAAQGCKVKKSIAAQPVIEVVASRAQRAVTLADHGSS